MLCCGNFLTFAKQAKPLGYFEALKHNFLGLGEAGSVESARSLGNDYPVGIWGNTYDAFNWETAPPRTRNRSPASRNTLGEEYPSSWPIQGYIAMQFLAEAIKKANGIDPTRSPRRSRTSRSRRRSASRRIRAKDHQANRGQLWGKTVMDAEVPVPGAQSGPLHRSRAVNGLSRRMSHALPLRRRSTVAPALASLPSPVPRPWIDA